MTADEAKVATPTPGVTKAVGVNEVEMTADEAKVATPTPSVTVTKAVGVNEVVDVEKQPLAGSLYAPEKVKIQSTSSPANPFCCLGWEWHPTHATVVHEGREYRWNARAHRKLRYVEGGAPDGKKGRQIHLLCWEPGIVTFHICWIGVIANTLWVVNGVYATWPEQAKTAFEAEMLSYVTGIVGAFLFIVTGYLGYVEAINQTHSEIRIPAAASSKRDGPRRQKSFRRPHAVYGHWYNPVLPRAERTPDVAGAALARIPQREASVLMNGYPLVEDVETRQLVTTRLFDRALEKHGEEGFERLAVGRRLDIRIGEHIVSVRATGLKKVSDSGEPGGAPSVHGLPPVKRQDRGYRWWTWTADLRHIAVVNSLIFFVATILFFIPACAWYPMAEDGASVRATTFWVYVLQIVPSVGFVYVGHASMAEAAGSWVRPAFDNLGWHIAAWNAIGGYGFLLCALLALPSVYDANRYDYLLTWGSAFSTFWGSCAFWIAGILQCVEFSSEHPIRW